MGFFDNIAAKLQAMTPEQWAAVKQQAQERRLNQPMMGPGTATAGQIENAVGALAARRGVGPAMTADPARAGAMVGNTLASLGGQSRGVGPLWNRDPAQAGAMIGNAVQQLVQMRAPTGAIRSVPEDQAAHYERLGATRVG